SYQTESFPTFVKAGNILPLDEFINESGFDRDYIFERAWKVAIYGGTTYGIPWRGAVSILYYNKELFEKAGLDPEVPPETMDEFLEYAKKLTGVEEDVYGFGVGPRDYHQNGQWNLRWGGAWFNDDLTRCVADSEESIAGFQFLADLFHVHKVAQPGAIAGQEPGTYGYFRDGKIGMTTQQPSLVTQIRNEKPEFKLGAAYVPKGPAPEPAGRACYSGVGMLAISKASKHAKEAWTLIQWLLTPEALRSWIGCLSAAVWAKVPLYEDDPVLSIVENARQYVFFWPYSEWVFKFWDLVTTYLEAIILGEMRVREGVTELVQKVNDILSESQV
ncbi:MAG: ABC transporter substrate-binding protein, partial [Anaerolineae bacterium]